MFGFGERLILLGWFCFKRLHLIGHYFAFMFGWNIFLCDWYFGEFGYFCWYRYWLHISVECWVGERLVFVGRILEGHSVVLWGCDDLVKYDFDGIRLCSYWMIYWICFFFTLERDWFHSFSSIRFCFNDWFGPCIGLGYCYRIGF